MAWQRRLPPDAVFTGATAAWIHGLDFDPADPVEIGVPVGSGVRLQTGLRVNRTQIVIDDVVTVRGLRATSILRTLLNCALRWPAAEALVAIDAALTAGLTNTAALRHRAGKIAGRPGAGRLRMLAMLAAPAESPMETRLRWLLIERGLPVPQVQVELLDGDARSVGRADLYYPTARLVLEFDGGNHRDRLTEDNRRQNLLVGAGFNLLRFTAADVYNRPEVVAAQVRSALSGPPVRTRDARRALGKV